MSKTSPASVLSLPILFLLLTVTCKAATGAPTSCTPPPCQGSQYSVFTLASPVFGRFVSWDLFDLFYSFPKLCLWLCIWWFLTFLRLSSCWSGCPDHGSLLQSEAGRSSSGRTRTPRTWSYGATTRRWRMSSTWSQMCLRMLSTAGRMCSGRPATATFAATAWLWCSALCPPAVKGSSRCQKSARISLCPYMAMQMVTQRISQ